MPRQLWTCLFVVGCLGIGCGPAPAEDPAKPDRYMRVQFDEKQKPKAMETAIVRFVSTDPAKADVCVDLIGAVHIGDGSYYEDLNKEFATYDALLYELVAPKGVTIPKGGGEGTGSFVSQLQIMMKEALALEFQLEKVDYTKDNFVHADMTPEEFGKSMERLNEDPLTLFLRLMAASARQQAESKKPPPNDFVILGALFDRKNGPIVLKRVFAEQLADADILLEALNGPGGSTIITERNKVAINVVGEQLEAGKKKLGVFYGAAHMQDMEERLVEKHGLKRDNVRWLKAWDLTAKTAEKKPAKDKTKPAEGKETDAKKADAAEKN